MQVKIRLPCYTVKITKYYLTGTQKTASGRIINFNSTQPLRQKLNTANNLINKAIDLSDEQFKDETLKR